MDCEKLVSIVLCVRDKCRHDAFYEVVQQEVIEFCRDHGYSIETPEGCLNSCGRRMDVYVDGVCIDMCGGEGLGVVKLLPMHVGETLGKIIDGYCVDSSK
ncbi:MAG: hypothetical protein O2779_01580 [Nanoarchaeota archaeon]|nr:hypothetical protein [Nanoarchaeota archaeon]